MDTRNWKVLVVEDDTAVRGMVIHMLGRQGLEAIGVETAEEGLLAFASTQPAFDLVIIDMLLPGVSGLDLAAELERRQPTVKILYISGCGQSIAIESMLRSCQEAVLLKPFSESQLGERVFFLLRKGAAALTPPSHFPC